MPSPKRNEPCPCGSGKKHKKCCGKNVKEIPVRDKEALQRQVDNFRAKFGRDPGPGDPIFFDPDSDLPVPVAQDKLNEGIAQAMKEAGVPPQFIYAWQKTGMLVSEQNYSQFSKADLREWNRAIQEYFDLPERN